MKKTTQKLVIAGIFIAIGVIGGAFSIPILSAKCSPVQHLVNVLSAILLGPWYAVITAFSTSLLRVIMGTGTLLAFPGSMCGALLAGIMYKYLKKDWFAYVGELVGTGIIGALIAYPVATLVMGREAALFGFVFPFMVSSLGGTVLAAIFYKSLKATKILDNRLQNIT